MKHLSCLNVFLFRCRTKHMAQDLSAEERNAIREMQNSIRERPDIFLEMEAFLPKKNGFDILQLLNKHLNELLFRYVTVRFKRESAEVLLCLSPRFLFRLYLSLVLGNINVTLLNKHAK